MLSFWSKKNTTSYALLPLSLVYGLASKVNIYLRGRNAYKAKPFVVSIGNINVGGAGKTPLTIALAEHFLAQGKKVAIVGHAYKANMQISEVVDLSFSVEQIGDEAMQMLRMLPSEVMMIVGKDRLAGVKLAEDRNADVILLDDAYTATYIARDLNIVVVDGKFQLGNKYVMPAGPLREPISGLNRSDCMVVINRHKNLDFAYDDDVFYLKTKIAYSKNLATSSLFAFCGLAMPTKFYNSLNKEGLCLQETKSFADHHKYTDQDIESLIAKAKVKNLQLVTTFKDIVKIDEKYHNEIQLIELKLELTKALKVFLDQKISNFDNK